MTDYLFEYVQKALSRNTPLPPPDSSKALQDFEILESLYLAHCSGGTQATKQAWVMIKRLRPEVVHYEIQKRLASNSMRWRICLYLPTR